MKKKKTLEDYGFPSNYSNTNKYQVYDFLINIYNDKSYSLYAEKYFKCYFPIIYGNCISYASYPDDFNFQQKLYHFFNDDKDLKLGLCKECGKRCKFRKLRVGYGKFCGSKCANSNKEKILYTKSVLKERYGDENYINIEKHQQTCKERYGDKGYTNREKYRRTCIEKYGVDNYGKLDECKEKIKQTNLEKYGVENYSQTGECKEKIKQTNLERYGVENYAQTDEFKEKTKQTNLERYGVERYAQTDDFKEKFKNSEWVSSIQEKSYQTKKKNHTFNSSKIEEEFADWLTKNNFNFESQYRSELYPFCCDFYLNDYNLYIEIQGLWTHGKHPYNSEDENDNNILSDWIEKSIEHPYYLNAIKVWTKRDVKKREMTKENNLNYLEIFSCNLDECVKRLTAKINTL